MSLHWGWVSLGRPSPVLHISVRSPHPRNSGLGWAAPTITSIGLLLCPSLKNKTNSAQAQTDQKTGPHSLKIRHSTLELWGQSEFLFCCPEGTAEALQNEESSFPARDNTAGLCWGKTVNSKLTCHISPNEANVLVYFREEMAKKKASLKESCVVNQAN